MKRYPTMREVIHNGSMPPKLGTYTPSVPYLVEKPKVLLAILALVISFPAWADFTGDVVGVADRQHQG